MYRKTLRLFLRRSQLWQRLFKNPSKHLPGARCTLQNWTLNQIKQALKMHKLDWLFRKKNWKRGKRIFYFSKNLFSLPRYSRLKLQLLFDQILLCKIWIVFMGYNYYLIYKLQWYTTKSKNKPVQARRPCKYELISPHCKTSKFYQKLIYLLLIHHPSQFGSFHWKSAEKWFFKLDLFKPCFDNLVHCLHKASEEEIKWW